jgi:hypothetical protein
MKEPEKELTLEEKLRLELGSQNPQISINEEDGRKDEKEDEDEENNKKEEDEEDEDEGDDEYSFRRFCDYYGNNRYPTQ